MKNELIKELEKKYWAAESSTEEEATLTEYVQSQEEEVSPEMTLLYAALQDEKNIVADFEIALPKDFINSSSAPARTISLYQWISVAASIVLLVGIFAIIRSYDSSDSAVTIASRTSQVGTEASSTDEAFQLVMESLNLVSETMTTTQNISEESIKETQAFEILNM